ncbi:sensor histidine kinase [Actinomadura rugatobispora]|uniref:histidine kinase n=1 Tax=Actinomadura rugatobispora TaxID=1994 RepID=A0ABW0ZX84_9ACTN
MQARLTALATAMAGALLLLGVLAMFVAVPVGHIGSTTLALLLGLGLGLVLGLPLVGWIVWHAVERALRPVGVMTSELDLITKRRGARRVSVPDRHDEVAELARAVNVTLERMEHLGERQRAWVADASHELRSPLTGLRTQLEAALQDPDEEDWPRVAQAVLSDADRLQRIVQDLLMMARLESGAPGERERIDLGALVRTETARRAVRSRVPIELETDEGVEVSGVRAHLVRLLTNLLDNAERHARSWVRVAVGSDGSDALMMVADDGPGIPREERERVFQRFQRLAEGRRCDAGGTGLGLPISRDIAHAHGGSLVVGECPDGARLILRIPLA